MEEEFVEWFMLVIMLWCLCSIDDVGVFVFGVLGVLIKLVKCCMLVLGDVIMGFVICGGGVSVYCIDCINVVLL